MTEQVTAAASAPLIQIRDLRKVFKTPGGEVVALDNIDLDINRGDIYGIIGMSGAGKSTLVRCINLLEKPTQGRVVIDGVEITALKPRELRAQRRKIGMIFQLFNLMPSRTIYSNVAFPLRGRGLSRQQKREKVMGLLKFVGLDSRAKAYPAQLSGGQKQRVAIARALATDPDVLLCDEATSALDPQTTQEILRFLKELNQTLGITVIIITHEMAVVKEICNRVAVTQEGRIVESGLIYDVFTRPGTPIKQRFLETVSNMGRVQGLLETSPETLGVQPGDAVVRLEFKGGSAGRAVISKLSREYEVDINILFGNVELLAGTPFGNLVVAFRGENGHVNAALRALEKEDIRLEVLRNA